MNASLISRVIKVELHLNFEDIGKIHEYFTNESLGDEKERCLAFLDKNADNLICNDILSYFPYNLVYDLFSRDTFCINEVDIFKLIVKWKEKHSTVDISGLLRTIRWFYVSAVEYNSVIRPLEIITDDEYFDWCAVSKPKRYKGSNDFLSALSTVEVKKEPIDVTEPHLISSVEPQIVNSTVAEQINLLNGENLNTHTADAAHTQNILNVASSCISSTEAHFLTPNAFEQLSPKNLNTETSDTSLASKNVQIKVEPVDDVTPIETLNTSVSVAQTLFGALHSVRPIKKLVKKRKQNVSLPFRTRKINNQTVFTCTICPNSVTFTTIGQILRHVIVHNPPKFFQCKNCDENFLSEVHLAAHICTGIRATTSESVTDMNLSLKSLPSTSTAQTAPFHTTPVLSAPANGQNGEQSFMVRSSSSRRDSNMVLVEHYAKPNNSRKKGSFWLTNKTFNKYSFMVSDGVKLFICEICKKSFGSRTVVLRHISTVHNGEKRFSCAHCNKRFTTKCGVLDHIEALHKQTKNYGCFSCRKSFGTKRFLQRHINRVHKILPQQSPLNPTITDSNTIDSQNESVPSCTNMCTCVMCWNPRKTNSSHDDEITPAGVSAVCSSVPGMEVKYNQECNEEVTQSSTSLPSTFESVCGAASETKSFENISIQNDDETEKYKLKNLAQKYKLKECEVILKRKLPDDIYR